MGLYCCLVSDKSCMARIMHFNFPQGIRFCFTSTSVKLQECNDASLNFNSISFFTHLVLYTKSQSVLCRPMGTVMKLLKRISRAGQAGRFFHRIRKRDGLATLLLSIFYLQLSKPEANIAQLVW